MASAGFKVLKGQMLCSSAQLMHSPDKEKSWSTSSSPFHYFICRSLSFLRHCCVFRKIHILTVKWKHLFKGSCDQWYLNIWLNDNLIRALDSKYRSHGHAVTGKESLPSSSVAKIPEHRRITLRNKMKSMKQILPLLLWSDT